MTKHEIIDRIKDNQKWLRDHGMLTKGEFLDCIYVSSFVELEEYGISALTRKLQISENMMGLDSYNELSSVEKYQSSLCF